MADTLDTPQTKKMQRERGREARKERWEEKDTRFHTREPYVKPSAQQWQDYAEQEAAYRKMAQDAAKAALAPTESETPAKKAAPGGGGGGSRGAKKQPQQKQAYAGEVDTELPVGVVAPDETAPYEEPEGALAASSAIIEAFPNDPSAQRIAEIYDEWASTVPLQTIYPDSSDQGPSVAKGKVREYHEAGIPRYETRDQGGIQRSRELWRGITLLLKKIEQDHGLEPGQALTMLPKAQQLQILNIRDVSRRFEGTGSMKRLFEGAKLEAEEQEFIRNHVAKGRTFQEKEALRKEAEEIVMQSRREEAMR